MNRSKISLIVGWFAVAVSTALCCFWAFWGVIENFHEGWYQKSIWLNLGMMLVQYMGLMIVFMLAAVVSIRWPWVGFLGHGGLGLFAAWFFRGASPLVLYPFIVGPLIILAVSFLVGRPEPKRWAYGLVILLPLATALICGIEPAIRVAGRFDDGIRNARTLETDRGRITWAPIGPGWPVQGCSWDEAQKICLHLNAAGTEVVTQPQGIWRLPNVHEAVASQHRDNQNCNGVWDPVAQTTRYQVVPDKESPIWNLESQVIYMWTATEIDDERAWMFAYDGRVWARDKRGSGHLGFRAIKIDE